MSKAKARIAIAGLLAIGCGSAAAQTYPTKPVRIIVPFAAGGGVDLTARILAQHLTERAVHTFFVENRPGASGIIGIPSIPRSRSSEGRA